MFSARKGNSPRPATVNDATTQFLYDGDALVGEYPATGNVPLRRYVHGPGVDNPIIWFEGAGVVAANASYLVADRLGSIVATADTAGTVTANYTYDAYGTPPPGAWSGPRFRYTGQIALPEAGLYYYKARVYDPASGRFLQTDPVGYGPDPNWYAYVGNDPVNAADPSGNCSSHTGCDDAQVEGATVGSASRIDSTSNVTVLATTTQNGPGANQVSSGRNGTGANQAAVPPSRGGSGYSTQLPTDDVAEGSARMAAECAANCGERRALVVGGMAATAGAGAAIGAAAAAGTGEAMVAAARSTASSVGKFLGPSGSIIGRGFRGGSSIFRINDRQMLRFGWGWKGSPQTGRDVLRFSGTLIKQLKSVLGFGNNLHIDIWPWE